MYNIDKVLTFINLKKTEKLSNRQIAKKIQVSKTTINRWEKIYISNFENLKNIIYSNKVYELIKKSKLDKENKKTNNVLIMGYIVKILQKNPCLKQKDIVNSIKDDLQISFNIKKLKLYLRKLRYTYKKPRQYIVTNIKFIDNLIELRKQFLIDIKNKNIDKIISIDECGFQKLVNKKRGLSLKGTAISVPKDTEYSNTTLILAITNKEILNYIVTTESVNGNIFNYFIKKIIDNLGDNKDFIFMMDNVKFHKNKDVQKMITDSGNSYLYVPPYSPNHNPIENLFSVLKKTYYDIPKEKDKLINISSDSTYYTHNYDLDILPERKRKKRKIIHKIKYYITEAIDKIKLKYATFSDKIFNRSISYDYSDITKELRDRIILS